jgi:membrane protein YdbS with pleckstrin-like domain
MLCSPSVRSWVRALWLGWLLVTLCGSPIQWILYFRRYFYDSDSLTITIRKGIITQKEVTLPFTQVTDVYVDQDIFDVLFGLYDVHISTATQESGQHAHIDGVCKKDALRLKELILSGINKGASASRAVETTSQ